MCTTKIGRDFPLQNFLIHSEEAKKKLDPAGWYIINTLWWVCGNVGMILLTHFESIFPSQISKNTKKHLRQSIQEWTE